jgi:diguanylate cyclase (GGDEF)-like protein/PAS domain S-box-containing protein
LTSRKEHELRVVLDAIPAPVFYKDAAGVYRGCNKAFEAYIGRPRNEIIGQDVYGISPRELADTFKAADDALLARGGTQIDEARLRHADGTDHDVVFHKATYDDAEGRRAGIVGTIIDITSRKAAERALEHAAMHDPLTGLPNRTLFMNRLQNAMDHARSRDERIAIAFVDLDGFKSVNDELGHDVGDRLLTEVARRLADSLRASDLIARVGGDEFCAILMGCADASAACSVAERLRDALQGPVDTGEEPIYVTASIGIALFPDDAVDAQGLIQKADHAMYRAKASGKNAVAAVATVDSLR